MEAKGGQKGAKMDPLDAPGFHMRYQLFLHYGWFLQNQLKMTSIRTDIHMTVCLYWVSVVRECKNGKWCMTLRISFPAQFVSAIYCFQKEEKRRANFKVKTVRNIEMLSTRICGHFWMCFSFMKLLGWI